MIKLKTGSFGLQYVSFLMTKERMNWKNTSGTKTSEKVGSRCCALLGAGKSLLGVAFR